MLVLTGPELGWVTRDSVERQDRSLVSNYIKALDMHH